MASSPYKSLNRRIPQVITATGSLTPRSLADRFSEIVNVKDDGAEGDGSTDDTEAIQRAFDRAAAAGGGEVVFPAGNFVITAPIISGSTFVYVKGAGIGKTYITWSGPAGDSMFQFGVAPITTSGWGIHDITFNGSTVTPILRCIHMYHGYLHRCRFNNTPRAVVWDNSYVNTINQCIFVNFGEYGISLGDGSGNRITNNYFTESPTGKAITFHSASNGLTVLSNAFEHNHTAIEVPNVGITGLWIGHNYFENDDNLIILGESGAGNIPISVTIEGSEFASINGDLNLFAAENLLFKGNNVAVDATFGSSVSDLVTEGNKFWGAKTINSTPYRDYDRGYLEMDAPFRSVGGAVLPSSGTGLEMFYSSGSTTAFINSINRSNSTYRPIFFGGSKFTFSSYLDVWLSSPPVNPDANVARLYIDNGGVGSKLRLMALFPSGAAQLVAAEP
jgi:parallel beta-helix repeat protein